MDQGPKSISAANSSYRNNATEEIDDVFRYSCRFDDFLNRAPPFDGLDDRTLADIGVDRHGRPVNSDDQRFSQQVAPDGRSNGWVPTLLTMGLFANWER